jgi:uncharacterized integral membrane protein (TIGR00697 family)
LISEIYGKKGAKECVKVGFVAILLYLSVAQIALRFHPAAEDTFFPHIQPIFSTAPRLIVASLCGYLISQFHDVWAYHFWKWVTRGKHLWLRNNLSTMVSQMIDSAVFCTIAFLNVYPLQTLISIFLTTYLFKVAVAALDTPFLYLAVFLHKLSQKRRLNGTEEGA